MKSVFQEDRLVHIQFHLNIILKECSLKILHKLILCTFIEHVGPLGHKNIKNSLIGSEHQSSLSYVGQ